MPASLDIIKNPEITVTTLNDLNIPSVQTFDKIKFNYKEEVEIEIPIPAKLKNLTIQVKG